MRVFIKSISLIALALLLCASAAIVSASSRFDYAAPIPFGAEVDTIAGLSEEEQRAAILKYYQNSDRQTLSNILYNFEHSVDPKYYAGAYFMNTDPGEPDLCILVTDMSVIPEIDNNKLHFRQVKYSMAELNAFRKIIEDEYLETGLHSLGTDIINNKIDITFFTWTDLSKLSELLPADSYEYQLSDEPTTYV